VAHCDFAGSIGEEFAVRRKRRAMSSFVTEGGEFIASAKLPEVTPFKAAQVFLAGLGVLAVEQFAGAAQVVFGQGLKRDVDFGGVGVAPSGGGDGSGAVGFGRGADGLLRGKLGLFFG